MLLDVADAQRMIATVEEVRRNKCVDIRCAYRSIGNATVCGFDFDQWLEPEQAARTVANDVDTWKCSDLRCHRIRSDGAGC